MATQDSWAFLLQHEDDRSWLPLDTPNAEILTGRYRIIARSHHRNASVQVNIAHTDTQSTPPQRRTKQRTVKSNDKGFVLVLPFTLMGAGTWTFDCIGSDWQHDLALTVLPQSHNQDEADWQPMSAAETDTPSAEDVTRLQPIVPAEPRNADPIANELEALLNPTTAPISSTPSPVTTPVDAVSLDELFGDASAASLGLASSDELASDLAAIGQPVSDTDLDADLWGDNAASPTENPLTQLEVVSDDDETLLDWESRLSDSNIAADASDVGNADSSDDDDLAVFDELFANLAESSDTNTDDFADLKALLSDDAEIDISNTAADSSFDLATDEAAERDRILTFPDVDAAIVETEDNSLLNLDDATDDATGDTAGTDTAPTDTETTDSDRPPAPSVWGIGTRTGATAAMAIGHNQANDQSDKQDDNLSQVEPLADPSAPTSTAPIVPAARQPEASNPQVSTSTSETADAEAIDSTAFARPDPDVLPFAARAATPTATTQTSITASPEEVAELIDGSDIVAASANTAKTTQAVASEATAPNSATTELPPLTVVLDPNIYTFRQGEILMVYGQVTAATMPANLPQGELVIKLIDPQNGSPIAQYHQPLENQDFPITIAAPLGIQDTVGAQLLVGEVALWDDGVEELTQHTFTATAAVDDLFAAIAAHPLPEDETKNSAPPLPAVDFGFFNFIGDAPADAPEPAPRKKRESMQEVDLPSGHTTPTANEPAAIAASISDADHVELENPLVPETADTETPETTADLNSDEPMVNADPLDLNLNANVELATDDSKIRSTSGQPLPDDWFDLPATDDQVGVDQVIATPASDAAPADAAPTEIAATVAATAAVLAETDAAPIANLDPAASEVVVDDLPEAPPQPKQAETTDNPLMIPAEAAIPEPTIELLDDGELVTGQAVRVRVKLPNLLPKLYVKLWINDRQTRTLLDGPRWMVDFVPNGHNELESITQLTVPFGSLEIQIAAITVEAATKRESYRAIIDRPVIPPNLDDDDDDALNFDAF